MMKWLLAATVTVALVGSAAAQGAKRAQAAADQLTVYRVATCGCCGKWVDHMKQAGFDVTVNIVPSLDQVPGRDRVPQRLRSCHLATAGPYVIEGHIPADVVKDFLRKRLKVEGLVVPGMPAGSPGMESPNPVPYEILTFDKSGATTVFARR